MLIRRSVAQKGPNPNTKLSRTRKSPTRSPARKQTLARSQSPPPKSPARRSPARKSPTRRSPVKKSPTRRSPVKKSPTRRSPARKSPARYQTTKDLAQKSIKSSGKITSQIKIPVQRIPLKGFYKAEELSSNAVTTESSRVTRSKRTTSTDQYTISDVVSSTIEISGYQVNGVDPVRTNQVHGLRKRRSLTNYTEPVQRSASRSLSKSVSQSLSQSIDTYSDEENYEDDLKKYSGVTKQVVRKLSTPPLTDTISKSIIFKNRSEFGGRVGSAILLILMPLTVFYILIVCSKGCSGSYVPDWSQIKSLILPFNWHLLAIMLGQCVLQALFNFIPIFGTKADCMLSKRKEHCFNAFFASVMTTSLLFGLDFYNLYKVDSLLNNYVSLALISYAIAVILSVILYIRAHNTEELNSYGITGYKLYDFWIGREIHPHIGKLSLKVWISRICNITALILTLIIFKRGIKIQTKGNEDITLENFQQLYNYVELKPTTLIFSMMQMVYLLSFIMREHKITSTFYWASEGIGYYQLVYSFLYPFYFTTISKYVADAELSLSTNTLVCASLLYLLGLLIMLISNNIKYEFRKNPLQPSLAHLESMVTFHGKKLLVSNAWRYARHPNYSGDLLVHLALSVPGVVGGATGAILPIVLHAAFLLHRSRRDDARCRSRYGAAWTRYCNRVPAVFIPKLF